MLDVLVMVLLANVGRAGLNVTPDGKTPWSARPI
jgi:hypothetical protein